MVQSRTIFLFGVKHFVLAIKDESLAAHGLMWCEPACRRRNSTRKGRCAYKRLSAVERLPQPQDEMRPVFLVRAHILLCMLAYYVEWHMRGWLKPLLYQDR